MGLGLKVHVGHVLGLEHDLGLGVDPSYKPCWDHITGTLCVPCIICNNKFENAMLDLSTFNYLPL